MTHKHPYERQRRALVEKKKMDRMRKVGEGRKNSVERGELWWKRRKWTG
jgi:hypothetical protein